MPDRDSVTVVRSIFVTLCLVVPLAFASQQSLAEIPGAKDPKAYTRHQYQEQSLDFNRRTLVDAYNKVGQRDPKWDAQATALLEAMARFASGADAYWIYPRPDVPTPADLEKLGRAALDAGCTDPLVRDIYCLALYNQGRTSEVLPQLRAAATDLAASKYPQQRIANSYRRLINLTDPQKQAAQRRSYDQILEKAMIASAKDVQQKDLRFVLDPMLSDFQNWPIGRQLNFYLAMARADSDPWITNVIGGIYHIDAAWSARGGGWAQSVSEEGWKKMRSELDAARECLVKAYELQPTLPEAPTQMITVVMGEGAAAQDTLRAWFDRAVTAQLDYRPAYDTYLYALLPRWFGDHPTMFAVGVECAQTGRFDTDVPYRLIETVKQIVTDAEGDWSILRQEGAIEQVANVLNGYAKIAADRHLPEQANWYRSSLAVYAWQAGDYAIGRKALDEISAAGGTVDDSLFAAIGLPRQRVTSGLLALTGPSGQALKDAEAQFAAGAPDKAIAAYRAAAGATPASDPASAWIRGRAQELEWQKQFNSGEWTSLMPADSEMNGWYATGGQFSADASGIIVKSGADPAMLLCGPKFGNRWELKATVAFSDVPAQKPATRSSVRNRRRQAMAAATEPADNHVGLFFGYDNNEWSVIRLKSGQIEWFPKGGTSRQSKVALGQSTDIFIQMWDGRAICGVGSTTEELVEQRAWPDDRIGIAAFDPAHTYTIKALQIRQLTTPPATIVPADPAAVP